MTIQHPIVVGVDTHADTLSAAGVDRNGVLVWEQTVPNSPAGITQLLETHPLDGEVWAIEGTGSHGRSLCDRLLAEGSRVREVPTRLTAQLRTRSGFAKSDPIDATVIARYGHSEPLATPKRHPTTEALRVLLGCRESLVTAQVRAVNRLVAALRELDPAVARSMGRIRSRRHFTQLTALVNPHGPGDPHRQALTDVIRLDAAGCLQRLEHIKELQVRIQQLLPNAGRALMAIHGIGLIGAATILAATGEITRFPTEGHYGRYAGTAPLDASSGNNTRQRLNRYGNRTLNRVIHTAIITQLRQGGEAATYTTRRISEGKTKNEAIRAAKRHLTRRIHTTLKNNPLT